MKKFYKRILPTTEQLRNSRLRKLLGESVFQYEVWHITRDSIAKGVAVGLFWAFIPVPMQMLLSAVTAIVLRCNIPVSIAMCWVTNPITFPFFLFVNYRLGVVLTFSEPVGIRNLSHYEGFFRTLNALWLPIGVGSIVAAITASAIGFLIVKGLWRLAVVRKRFRRLKKYAKYERN